MRERLPGVISNQRLSRAFYLYTLEPLMDGNWLMPEMLGQHLSCVPNAKCLAGFDGARLLSELTLFSALKSPLF